ncbi:MAG: hypothetical protein PWP31_1591 [Clostridia bacterium]|nr:hypothetical protein [Clostridia bacterium]
MGDLNHFFTVIGAIFSTSVGITDLLKSYFPWLGKPLDDPDKEKKREQRVILVNATIAAILTGVASIDVFSLLGLNSFSNLKITYPYIYLFINMIAVGVMSIFGSPFLHELITILMEFKKSIRIKNQLSSIQLLSSNKKINKDIK